MASTVAGVFSRALRSSAVASFAGVQRRCMAVDARVVRAAQSTLAVQTEKVTEDLTASQVLVKMMAAPITPTDLASAKSGAVAGNEGIGQVVGVGPSVSGLAAGDLVVPAKTGFGTWRTHALVTADDVIKVDANTDALEAAATAVATPLTAEQLVNGFVNLSSGDVIIQNNAGSTVGQAVVQKAAAKGIKTINIMRSRDNWADMKNHFDGLGATVTVTEEFARTPEFAALIADLPAPKLALSSVGGKSSTILAKTLANGGTLVTYGGMTRERVSIPMATLVENDITVRGFSLAKHLEAMGPAAAADTIATAVANADKTTVLLAREPFDDFELALKRATTPGERKVVLIM